MREAVVPALAVLHHHLLRPELRPCHHDGHSQDGSIRLGRRTELLLPVLLLVTLVRPRQRVHDSRSGAPSASHRLPIAGLIGTAGARLTRCQGNIRSAQRGPGHSPTRTRFLSLLPRGDPRRPADCRVIATSGSSSMPNYAPSACSSSPTWSTAATGWISSMPRS